ncbi:hypothetical protein ATANTOWER_022226 [Ataeniobius toweri]|uniref:Uncharacterized protein n=1 Tax=Ataeniobius toweri TaxID=208326 RepID=A0ABU7AGH7_9TELE|nr:hypothetical protein [Ataeniobius toweri]
MKNKTEYKDIYAAPGKTKFNFSALLQTRSTQQNVIKGWIWHDMSPLNCGNLSQRDKMKYFNIYRPQSQIGMLKQRNHQDKNSDCYKIAQEEQENLLIQHYSMSLSASHQVSLCYCSCYVS